MDFFERQAWARRRTAVLLLAFALAVVAIVALVLGLVWWLAGLYHDAGHPAFIPWLSSPLASWVGGATAAIILVGSMRRWWQLSDHGGDRVARMLGGRPVDPASPSREERELLAVVEEVAIAAGLSVPGVYVLDREPGLNAFAAGLTPEESVIAVTRGMLESLNRTELQGVVAHEMSHVLNSDTRLNMRMLALLAGIAAIGELGAWLWHRGGFGHRRYGRTTGLTSASGGRGSGLVLLLGAGLCLIAIGWLGVLMARVIKAAVSRHREFLADAASVQFTRNPDGIGGALLKIHRAEQGSTLDARRAEAISHMGFGRTVVAWSRLTATHPSVEARMTALGPKYRGRHRRQQRALDRQAAREARANAADAGPGSAAGFGSPLPNAPGEVFTAAAMAALAGRLDERGVAHAQRLLNRIPAGVREAVHEPARAPLVVYALMMHGAAHRNADLAAIPAFYHEAVNGLRAELERACPGDEAGSLAPAARLALLELAMTGLMGLSRDERERMLAVVDDLIEANGGVSVFEYAARTLLTHRLTPRVRRAAPTATIRRRRRELRVVLTLLAQAAGRDETGGTDAYERARAELDGEPGAPMLTLAEASRSGFSTSLEGLCDLGPGAKRAVLRAAAACVAADGRMMPAEAELLRVLACALAVPIPPLAGADGTDQSPAAASAMRAE